MPIVGLIAASALAVWVWIYARQGALLLGCLAFLVIGYVFGHSFWNADFGPVPLTLDRLLLVGLVGALAIQWKYGSVSLRPLTGVDWLVASLIAYLTVSAVLFAAAESSPEHVSPFWRLVASFWMPAALYAIGRVAPIHHSTWKFLLGGFVVLGTYLGVTAVAEITGQWWAVFPRYISDPELGQHFGRARGPALMSASLGVWIAAAAACAWTLRGFVSRGWQLVLFAALPVMVAGIFFTYTRSTWLGLAVSGMVILLAQLPRQWRWPVLATTAVTGLAVAAIAWGTIVGLQREGSPAESQHSVQQRAAFAYVSWQMFQDHPLLGVGFGRFFDAKLPYLADRSQPFELESLRTLHHHNTFLSVLTETGMVGLFLFVGVLIGWGRWAWRLCENRKADRWMRSQGALTLAVLTAYAVSALFHDLTFSPTEHWLVFLMAGIAVALAQGPACEPVMNRSVKRIGPPRRGTLQTRSWGTRITLFGISIDRLTMKVAASRLLDWCQCSETTGCRYVVTPNLDHAVMFQHRADLRTAYADASLVLADGAPLVWASRLFDRPLPERVAGSDLVPFLFNAASEKERPLRVFLLGAAPQVAREAAARIEKVWPNVQVVGRYSPPIGFEHDRAANQRILRKVAAAQPDLLIVGLGAPKQELWIHAHRHELQSKVAICAGATIDFLAGHRQRSPRWMRQVGLEWLHRLSTEPGRLAGRYARDAMAVPKLLWGELRQSLA